MMMAEKILLVIHTLTCFVKLINAKANQYASKSMISNQETVACPDIGDDPFIFPYYEKISVNVAPIDTLCTLSLKTTKKGNDILIPIGRSYDNNEWETVAGSHTIKFSCTGASLCHTTTQLPVLEKDEVFQLTTFGINELPSLSSSDIAARFLEQTTFGTTTDTLKRWKNVALSTTSALDLSFANWIDDQINSVPMSSHREFFRKRTSTRYPNVHQLGVPSHPCAAGTRWHSYTFTNFDANTFDTTTFQGKKLHVELSSDAQKYVLMVDNIPRTEVHSVQLNYFGNTNTYHLTLYQKYDICLGNTEETQGGQFLIGFVDSYGVFLGCYPLDVGNPSISFSSSNPQLPPNTITLTPQEKKNFIFYPGLNSNEIFTPSTKLVHAKCSELKIGSYPVYVSFGDGTFYAFDPRIEFNENTLENPLVDGGGGQKIKGSYCSNAPRTFLNADSCILSREDDACSDNVQVPDKETLLTKEGISSIQELTGRYVYAINGLRPQTSPCTFSTTSRWARVGADSLCPLNNGLDSATNTILSDALTNSYTFETDDLRDISMLDQSNTCNMYTTNPIIFKDIKIVADSSCWKLVHPNHHDIYDMTPFVALHPGGGDKIKAFAMVGSAFLLFPNHHEMWRWEVNKASFGPKVGTLNHMTNLRDFPEPLQTREVAIALLGEYSLKSGNTIVCGSPNEVASQVSEETIYNSDLGFGTSDLIYRDKSYQKQAVWTSVVMNGDDQLRQRMAWAISQIFPIDPATLVEDPKTESFTAYYDIFVRHAFGNYLDILREVSYSGFMGGMLTYLNSLSAAFVLKYFKKVSFADENFAREIMQLFTIGLKMLNMDGTEIIDPNTGAPALTYTNDHIMSFARAWTGFTLQPARANIDQRDLNRIDPMLLIGERRDVFPKIDLLEGYIGDGYPLCVDLPHQSFLRKGAKYRLLGSSSVLELTAIPPSFDPLTNLFVLDPNSSLHNKLCNPTSVGESDCDFKTEVILDTNIDCFGKECLVDTLQLLRVTNEIYFEYVRTPCVQMPFYQNAKTITYDFNFMEMCGDPRIDAAGEACCADNSDFMYEKNCEYGNERVMFETASQRCSDISGLICATDFIMKDPNCVTECCEFNWFYHWIDSPCSIQVKIEDVSGKIAVVHKPSERLDKVPQHLRNDSSNLFPVYWESDYPNTSNNCGGDACEIVEDGCLCTASVTEEQVFTSAPISVDDLLSKLHVGSVSPDTFDEGEYSEPTTVGDMKIYFKNIAAYDADTIFEVRVRNKVKFFKNMKSTVQIFNQDRSNVIAAFRNPPHFMSFVEADTRDAHYETDAVLEHYVHHPNVPPFLALHFIQRFGISNPSPNYIETVAIAFRDGIFVYDDGSNPSISYGSGNYADLGATIAAVILHREARSIVLDLDPAKGSLREPLLKVISFLRAMEYEPFDRYTHDDEYPMKLYGARPIDYKLKKTRLVDLSQKIGQEVYYPPNIFSFFRREFAPNGVVQQASLVAPEAQRYLTPQIIDLVNGFLSIIKFGLNSCYKGFGETITVFGFSCSEEGRYVDAIGKLGFSPENPTDPDNFINEMATLLTAGRLSQESRNIISTEVEKAQDDDAGLRVAQQLMVVSPEFHSTNLHTFSGENRFVPDDESSGSLKPYKAVVYLLLQGGFDSFNLIVPHSGCSNKDMYAEYVSERRSVALGKGGLLQINSGNDQDCSVFGVHPDLPILKTLYDEKDLSFFSNVGVLFEHVSKDNWDTKTLSQLFAHNTQQKQTQQVDPFSEVYGTGVIGRMADALTMSGFRTGSFSVSGEAFSLLGEGHAPPIKQIDVWSDPEFNSKPSHDGIDSAMFRINNLSTDSSGFFAKTWSDMFEPSVKQTKLLQEKLENTQTTTVFPDSHFGRSMDKISSLIKIRSELGHDRQMFHVTHCCYDSHLEQAESLKEVLPDLNAGIDAFVKEMKEIGMWENVVLVCASDFGRTLTPNSGEGTDHGWGGNYFVFGGSMNGGRILGQYPDDLTEKGPLNIGRGRFIPTTSWDTIMNSVAEWAGVTGEKKLSKVLPNREKFQLYENGEMFPPPPPSPLTMQPSSYPTEFRSPNPTSLPSKTRPTKSPTKNQSGSSSPSKDRFTTKSPSRSPSPSTSNLWFIGKASIVMNINEGVPQMEFSHTVGTGADDVRVSLYMDDCETQLSQNDPVTFAPTGTVLVSGLAKYVINLDTTNISNSVVVNNDRLQLCAKLELLDGPSGLSVTFRKTRVEFDFDLSVGYFQVTYSIEELDVDNFDLGDLSFYQLRACQCQTSFDCDESPMILDQNEKFGVCVYASSSGVEFVNFDLTVRSDNGGFEYSPISLDPNTNDQVLHLGTQITTNGVVTKVTAPLVTGLFESNSDQITVSGSGQLRFADQSESALKQNAEVRRYEVSILLKTKLEEETSLFASIISFFSVIFETIAQVFSIVFRLIVL